MTAQLWILSTDGWRAFELCGDAFALEVCAGHIEPRPLHAGHQAPGDADAPALLLHRPIDGADTWILFAEAGVRVARNGEPVALGVVVLADRDEIRLPGAERAFLGLERRAVVAPFRARGEKPCARCNTEVVPGEAAVECPRCGALHHERPGLDCWTSVARCRHCEQPTSLETDTRWTPEELWPVAVAALEAAR